jgi:hypothetical protein
MCNSPSFKQTRNPHDPLALLSNYTIDKKAHPTQRQKRNWKIFPRIRNPYFTESVGPGKDPFVLQLNFNPPNPFIVRPSKYHSHRVVATTGSQPVFLIKFHPLDPIDPAEQGVVKKLGEIISNLYIMTNNRQDIHPKGMNSGIMRGVGFRPGSDSGSTAGQPWKLNFMFSLMLVLTYLLVIQESMLVGLIFPNPPWMMMIFAGIS